MKRGILFTWLACGSISCAETAPLPADCVVTLRATVLSPRADDSRTRQRMFRYHEALVAWDNILLAQFQPVPGRPGCGYYGEGGNEENQVRPIAYAAAVNAFLAESHGPGIELSPERRAKMREHAIGALRYLASSHVANGGKCLNGKSWGNQWQSAMWAYSAGMAGWFVWDQLPENTANELARLIEFEANRFLNQPPKSSRSRDTGAEENAWNAQILSLAANLMPRHPRSRDWERVSRLWMYNTLSAAADREDATPGDYALPISNWVSTVNVNPDFTIENHGLVHVGYLKTSLSLLLENALPFALSGSPVPRACLHHVPECFEVLLSFMGDDGAAVYCGGNDWKLVHTQPADVGIYALVGLLSGDPRASRLEEVALGYVRNIQKVENGHFNIRRDLEWGGACAIRMITAWLMHGRLGPAPDPIPDPQLNAALHGVRVFEDGKVIVHRGADSFASFSWGSKRMALTLPANGNWVIWPHFGSSLGQFNGRDASQANASLLNFRKEAGLDSFKVSGELERTREHTRQAFAFVSTREGVTLYLEHWMFQKPGTVTNRETGIVGLEYSLGRNSRQLFHAGGTLRATGSGGATARSVQLRSNWLNIDDRIGYVVCRPAGKTNIMTYHDEVRGVGRVPKLQEWISLAGDDEPVKSVREDGWACVITFPNQTHRGTRSLAERVRFSMRGNTAMVDYGNGPIPVELPRLEAPDRELPGS